MNILNIPNLTFWIHEISQSALAAAVATLGLVILLELRAISRLRRAMDTHLARVFEQLDLMRSQHQLVEVQSPATPVPQAPPAPAAAAAYSAPMGSGEARLAASLAAARARLTRTATAA